MTRAGLHIVSVLALAGCATLRGPVIGPAQLADPPILRRDSSQSGFLHRIGTLGVEDTPDGIDREVVADQVDIQSVAGERICFDVDVRTSTSIDQPLATWVFRINKASGIARETASSSTQSFPIISEQTTLRVHSRWGGLRVQRPVEGSFDVVERHGVICGYLSRKRPQLVTLLMKIPGGLPADDWYQRYDFTLVP